MIDLEYYGVSVYEQSAHPNPALDALRLFFRRLEFDVTIEGTRVHARYDKERALDLGDICDKAELLFRLRPLPHGRGLDDRLPEPRRRGPATGWPRRGPSRSRSGASSRSASSSPATGRGSSLGVESGPDGRARGRVVRRGALPGPLPRAAAAGPPARGSTRRCRGAGPRGGAARRRRRRGPLVGQIRLERQLLRPLREARGARRSSSRPRTACGRSPPELFERRHEAEVFAEMLARGRRRPRRPPGAPRGAARADAALPRHGPRQRPRACSARSCPCAGRASASTCCGTRAGSSASRSSRTGTSCGRRRDDGSRPWEATWSTDPGRARWRCSAATATSPPERSRARSSRRRPRRSSRGSAGRVPSQGPRPLPGERVLQGFRASPGRAVGRALFGTEGRVPGDFDGAVLVAPSVRPEDNTFLYHARGIVSTGGGILSHAGLIATQFQQARAHRLRPVAAGARRLVHACSTARPSTARRRREVEGCRGRRSSATGASASTGSARGTSSCSTPSRGRCACWGRSATRWPSHEELWRLGEAGRRLAPRRRRAGGPGAARAAACARPTRSAEILGRLSDPVLARHAAHELARGRGARGGGREPRRAGGAPRPASRATAAVGDGRAGLPASSSTRRAAAAPRGSSRTRPRRRLPTAASAHEILARRLETLRLGEALEERRCLAARVRRRGRPRRRPRDAADIDAPGARPARGAARRAAAGRCARGRAGADPRRRHLLRADRAARPRPRPPRRATSVRRARARLARGGRGRPPGAPRPARRDGRGRRASSSIPLIGWKAANLAEVARLGGRASSRPGSSSPTARSRRCSTRPSPGPDAEAVPPGASTLREAIDAILARGDLDNVREVRPASAASGTGCGSPRSCAGGGRGLPPPRPTRRAPAASRTRPPAGRSSPSAPRPARRTPRSRRGPASSTPSSSSAARSALLEHLKRAWSGLWTERAIHNRALLGPGRRSARAAASSCSASCWSRVSGVLQTVNVAEGEPREMVINVGLGLGEGIVSGTVAADHVVVAKEGDLERGPAALPLRHRATSASAWSSTGGRASGRSARRRLYHQRLRPALEYVELCELVAGRRAPRGGLRVSARHRVRDRGDAGSASSRSRPVATFLSRCARPWSAIRCRRTPSALRRGGRRHDPTRRLARVPRRRAARQDRAAGDQALPDPAGDAPRLPARRLLPVARRSPRTPRRPSATPRAATWSASSPTAPPCRAWATSGPLAAKPMQEGMAVLFKRLADIDVFDLELDATRPRPVRRDGAALEPTFGGINLKDIRAPEGLDIYDRLREQPEHPGLPREPLQHRGGGGRGAPQRARPRGQDDRRGPGRHLRRRHRGHRLRAAAAGPGRAPGEPPRLRRQRARSTPTARTCTTTSGPSPASDPAAPARGGAAGRRRLPRRLRRRRPHARRWSARWPASRSCFALATPEPEIGYEAARASRRT